MALEENGRVQAVSRTKVPLPVLLELEETIQQRRQEMIQQTGEANMLRRPTACQLAELSSSPQWRSPRKPG